MSFKKTLSKSCHIGPLLSWKIQLQPVPQGLLKLLIVTSQKRILGRDHSVLSLSLCPSLNIHIGCHLRWDTGLERPFISFTRAFVIWRNGKIHPGYACAVQGKERVYRNCVKKSPISFHLLFTSLFGAILHSEQFWFDAHKRKSATLKDLLMMLF